MPNCNHRRKARQFDLDGTDMDRIERLESESVYILREAFSQVEKLAMLWSLGKDSNVMIWLARKAFFGAVPFPVVHLDTQSEFPQTYAFREQYTKEWGLRLIADICPPIGDIDPTLPPASRSAARKSAGLKRCLAAYGFNGLIVGIRRDEQAIRAKERVFSPRSEDGDWDYRDQPPEFWNQYCASTRPGSHLRIHPLLSWTELDIWRYVAREGIPLVPLYFAKDGVRYRSLGEMDTTAPIVSNARTVEEIINELVSLKTEERSGRLMDHETEDAFEKLRLRGYL
jgi:sulfate adenylyltransferase subunit 2